MSEPVDPEDHPLQPEDDDWELRYDERTLDDDRDEGGADSEDAET